MTIQEIREEILIIKGLIGEGTITTSEQADLEAALVALQDSLIYRLDNEINNLKKVS